VTTHELKTWPPFWEQVDRGTKTFELRYNDRDYKVGDVLRLLEWEPAPGLGGGVIPGVGSYTGRECVRRVVYMLEARQSMGLVPDFVVLGLGMISDAQGRKLEATGQFQSVVSNIPPSGIGGLVFMGAAAGALDFYTPPPVKPTD